MYPRQYQYSATSRARLVGVHPVLVRVANMVIAHTDCAVVYGVRQPVEQKRLFDAGLSKTLDSKHLMQPDGWCHALDLAPVVNGLIPWEKKHYFYHFAGVILTVADIQGVEVRWGGDWDSDRDLDDQTFMDLVHFELVLSAQKITQVKA